MANGVRRTGVLFVHGVGEQVESESVRWFAGALLRWLDRWHAARGGARSEVVASNLSYGARLDGPARVEVRIPEYAAANGSWPERQWIIAEGWWAARISPPDLGQMIGWAARSSARSLNRLLVEAGDRVLLISARLGRGVPERPVARSDPGAWGAAVELLSTSLLALLYLAALPVIYLTVALLYLLTLVPVERWRTFTITELIAPFLVKGLGDFATYLEDDVQGLHIRGRIEDDVKWLVEQGRCDDVIVVAHSHGTVVAFDALVAGRMPHLDRVRKFITIGAALNNAFLLYGSTPRMRRTLPDHIYWLDVWSYYDPVPGGQLVRRATPGAPALVAPRPEIRERYSWYEEHVFPGSVPDGSKTPPSSALPRQVTNEMNVVTDHDGYWRNPEQFLGRIASEADQPDADYRGSRFHFTDLWKRTKRRRFRVTTLVGWRLATMLSFAVAMTLRIRAHGLEQLARDGAGVADWVSRLPGAAVLGIPGELGRGLRDLVDAGAQNAGAIPPVAALLRGVADWLAQPVWSDRWHVVLGTVFIGALFAAVHLGLLWALWRPWDEREARESVAPELPEHRTQVALRSVAAILPVAILALIVADLTR